MGCGWLYDKCEMRTKFFGLLARILARFAFVFALFILIHYSFVSMSVSVSWGLCFYLFSFYSTRLQNTTQNEQQKLIPHICYFLVQTQKSKQKGLYKQWN